MDSSSVYITSEMLTDLRRPNMPTCWESVQDMPKVAWKTGTSYGHKDALAIGYTADYIIGIRVGNVSGNGVAGLTGMSAAGPLLISMFREISKDTSNDWFVKPKKVGKREICSKSGKLSKPACSHTKSDYYIIGKSNIKKCDIHEFIFTDLVGKMELCSFCKKNRETKTIRKLTLPNDVSNWMNEVGYNHDCLPHNPKCNYFNNGNKPKITSPISKIVYSVGRENKLNQKICLKAGASTDVDSVFWFIDGALITKSHKKNPFFWNPLLGEHKLICLDDKGRYDKTVFTVQ